MKKTLIAVVIVAFLGLASFPLLTSAAKSKPPEGSGSFDLERVKKPMTAMLQLFSSPDMTKLQAGYYKNLYDSLIKSGFDKSQALQIVTAQGSLITGAFGGGGRR